jgi:hypothetical protein
MAKTREFVDVRRGGLETEEPLPVEAFMKSLDDLQHDVVTTRNHVWERVADGTLSIEHLKRL